MKEMSPNSGVAMRISGQGRTTEAKPQAQGTVDKGMPPETKTKV